MAHLALTDVEAGTHRAVERFSRENPALAGATAVPLRVWLEDWQLTETGSPGVWRLQAADGELALDLWLTAQKPPVLQGQDGLSRKSAEPGNASYYYSMTRLETTGSVRSGSTSHAVVGSSWLDREWSTSALGADQSGWDWFSLQFDDGQELMYYQLRDNEGLAHPNSLGNWTDADAGQSLITPGRIELTELEYWTSPAGVRYTTAWRLQLDGQIWQIRAVLPDQWMNLSIPYWEGAVDILNMDGTAAGRGFLEMVRP
jgi:predicted secreted hydrolase